MRFFLGTHETSWLATAGVPLFVSRRRLARRKSLPRAAAPWALDSGGFTELQMYGRWAVSAEDYAREVRRYAGEVGMMLWAAPQDWMCEDVVIRGGTAGRVVFKGTGLSVAEHQRRTVENLLRLRQLAPDLPFIPVLQGQGFDDYLKHADDYLGAGIDLAREPLVGCGSVCRREKTDMVESLVRRLQGWGIRAHGFGMKTRGLARCSPWLASADSLAWSYQALRRPPLSGCPHAHCQNCLIYALRWRENVLRSVERGAPAALAQRTLFDGPPTPPEGRPECGSADVAPPLSDCLSWCCVECGASWGHLLEGGLT